MTGFHAMEDASRDAITVRGHDLARDLISGVGFTDMILLELIGGLSASAARTCWTRCWPRSPDTA
ncbi:hypothetical protein ACFQ3B_07790 [Stackebrandtia endophytica]|uniref:hypothetical protein n=1 Tax=Stackebrandtia endophytica TaxID=1496996 RepID=UPI001150980C|nr:hypothetical protein [Stackebrandtia endophytica]